MVLIKNRIYGTYAFLFCHLSTRLQAIHIYSILSKLTWVFLFLLERKISLIFSPNKSAIYVWKLCLAFLCKIENISPPSNSNTMHSYQADPISSLTKLTRWAYFASALLEGKCKHISSPNHLYSYWLCIYIEFALHHMNRVGIW